MRQLTIDKLIKGLQEAKEQGLISGDDYVFIETRGNFGEVLSDCATDIYITTNMANQKMLMIVGED